MDLSPQQDLDLIAHRLAAIVDNSDDAIVGKDLRSVVTSWNAGAERIFGYTAREMIGSSILKIIPEERRDEELQILSRIKMGERVDHFETIRMTKGGKRLNVSITVSPIKDSSGKIVGASKIARDITDRVLFESALRKAKEEAELANAQRQLLLEREQTARTALEKASRVKDEFLATLSHELRTPLNAILGWATILRDRPGAAELTQGLETIARNARAQAQIIDDLLDMSRIVSGKIRLDVQSIDLASILGEALATVRPAADARGVTLRVICDPHHLWVNGDPNRLQQVFWNILNNAIKFTSKNGWIQVMMKKTHSQVEVSVKDSGEGIEAEFLPFVFNRFEQADATITRRHGGLGLGLAIVKQLVELHGGRVKAESPGLGQGSTFTVLLPLSSIRPDLESELSPGAATIPAISLEGIRVLVIDDENDARQLVKKLLELAGAEVLVGSSAPEGLELLFQETFDILICDIGMPDEDGYSLIRRVRSLDLPGGDLAAIALTAYARSEDRTKALSAGFQYHLAKPVESSELLAAVHSLARSRVRR